MADFSLLLIGPMGHIGGAVLDKLIETHTELDICAVVRSEKDSAILKKQYGHASFNTAIGNLHDTELMEKLAKNATIIVNCGPDSNQGPGIKALLQGQAARNTHAYYIGTSGAANIWGPPTGDMEGRIWDDVADTDEMRAMPESVSHVTGDNIVLGASTSLLHTAIVSPSWVMGISPSITHPTPITLPDLLQVVKGLGSGVIISKGINRLSFVHVKELARLYVALVDDALNRLRTGQHDDMASLEAWGPKAYYFGANMETSFLELMRDHVLPALKTYEAPYPLSDEINQITLAEALESVMERLGDDAKPDQNRWRVEQYAVPMRARGTRAEEVLNLQWAGGDAGISEAIRLFLQLEMQ